MTESLLKPIPHELHATMHEGVLQAHQRLSGVPLDLILRLMPEVQSPVTINHAGYVDISPEVDHDNRKAIVLPLPFANGWTPHMWMRAHLLAASLDEPTRLIVFPNNTVDERMYTLDSQQASVVKDGDVMPIVEKQLSTLDALQIERVHLLGYSQGAMLGAVALRGMSKGRFDSCPSGLFEWPNGVDRSYPRLGRDFVAAAKHLSAAVEASQIPALDEAFAGNGLRDNYKFLKSIFVQENRALWAAMTKDNFYTTLSGALIAHEKLRILLGGAQSSRVAPKTKVLDDVEALQAIFHGRVDYVGFAGDHAAGDNIVLHAALGKAAVESRPIAA